MGVIDDLADDLARDTIAFANETGDDNIIRLVGEQLGASSSTMQEAYQTSIRVRLAERRARQFLETERAKTKGAAPPPPDGGAS